MTLVELDESGLQRVLDLGYLAQRAYAAADARGIATHDLRLAEEHLELDSGGWRGELLSVVMLAWPGCDVSIHYLTGQDTAVMEILPGTGDIPGDLDSWEKWNAASCTEVLVAALEAAPQPTEAS